MKKIFLVLVLSMLASSVFAAVSATRTSRNVMGNQVAETYDLTITSATGGTFKTGMSHLYYCDYHSATTNDLGVVFKNSTTASSTEDDGGALYVLFGANYSSEAGDVFCIGKP